MADAHLLYSSCLLEASVWWRRIRGHGNESLGSDEWVRRIHGPWGASGLTTQTRKDDLARLEIPHLETPGRGLVPARLDVICRRRKLSIKRPRRSEFASEIAWGKTRTE